MKRTVIIILLSTLIGMTAWCAPALRGPFTVRQADGTLLTVEQFGDEYHHWTATTDGTLVVSTTKGYYVAQIDDEGRLTATHVLAHEPALRSHEEQQMAAAQVERRALFHQRGERQCGSQRALSISESGNYLPHTGNVRVLVILAAYNDLDFIVNNPQQAFDQLLNGETQEPMGNHNELVYASARRYFETCSFGQFSPRYDVVGPVKLPDNMADYGGTATNGGDDKVSKLSQDAVNAVKDQITDWSVYDNDNDGTAELVCIIFAGYGQNQGGPVETIWAKNSRQDLKVNDDYTITRVCCCSELFYPAEGFEDYINGTGTFLHEFSHGMGLPDIYATVSSAHVNNQSMERWDLMDVGLYNRNGFAPAAYLAWEREAMGWLKIKPLSESGWTEGLLPIEEGGTAYKIQNVDNENDFIVLENIQRRGINSYAYGHGLLVYHVAYSKSELSMGDNPNNRPGYPAVAVVPADGVAINSYLAGKDKEYTNDEYANSLYGDPFPGTSNVTEVVSDEKHPNYHFYAGDAHSGYELLSVGYAIRGIAEDAESGQVTFHFGTPDEDITSIEGGRGNVRFQDSSSRFQDLGACYNLKGQRVTHPTKGIYVVGNRKVVF